MTKYNAPEYFLKKGTKKENISSHIILHDTHMVSCNVEHLVELHVGATCTQTMTLRGVSQCIIPHSLISQIHVSQKSRNALKICEWVWFDCSPLYSTLLEWHISVSLAIVVSVEACSDKAKYKWQTKRDPPTPSRNSHSQKPLLTLSQGRTSHKLSQRPNGQFVRFNLVYLGYCWNETASVLICWIKLLINWSTRRNIRR